MHANQTPDPTRSTTPSEHHPALVLPVSTSSATPARPDARFTTVPRPLPAPIPTGASDETEEAGYGYGV